MVNHEDQVPVSVVRNDLDDQMCGTFADFFKSAVTNARPIPEAPPVTIATLPEIFMVQSQGRAGAGMSPS